MLITQDHVRIPQTKVYIVPPPDFKVANDFIGLIKNENICILLLHISNRKYEVAAQSLSEDKLTSIGFKVMGAQEAKLNSYQYKKIIAENRQARKFIFFILGDDSFSINITVFGLEQCNETQQNQIEAALLSIVYHEKEEVNYLAETPFELDDSQSAFKFQKTEANTLYYTLKEPSNSMFPYFVVFGFRRDNSASLADIADIFFQEYSKTHTSSFETKHIVHGSINGYEAYQVEKELKANDKQSLYYQVIVANEVYVVVMTGVCDSEHEQYLAEFEKLIKTIKIKDFN